MQGVGTFLLLFGFASAVPLILINTLLWMRFTALYARSSSEKMPFLPLDFGGRWQQALRVAHVDPGVERLRRQLRISQRLLLVPLAVAWLATLLIVAAPK